MTGVGRSPSKVSSRRQGLARIVQRTLGSETWPPSGSLSWSRSGSLGIKPKDPSISHDACVSFSESLGELQAALQRSQGLRMPWAPRRVTAWGAEL